jgi:hypothetical protein
MKLATATPVAGLMRKEAFIDRTLDEAMGEYVISPNLGAIAGKVHHSHSSRLVGPDVVEIRYSTRFEGLTENFALKHVYSFPLLNEVRETGFVLGSDSCECTSEVLIALKNGAKGYVNIAANDSEGYMLRATVLTYDRNGDVRPYVPVIPDKFTSPLTLGKAELCEIVDEAGRRVLRLLLELPSLTGTTKIKVGYNTLGIHEVREFAVGPADPVVVSDLLLENNPALLPGEWVIAASDAQDRMLVNGIVRITPAQAPCRSAA